ncbi:hypothetical protein ONZ45_g11281 [Pleurotus djamor]|nr:hypothetical protein ONZ45_g11281 [Pleurotus djamor]
MLRHPVYPLLALSIISVCAARYAPMLEQAPLTVAAVPSRSCLGLSMPTPTGTAIVNAEVLYDCDDEDAEECEDEGIYKTTKKKTTKKTTSATKKSTSTTPKSSKSKNNSKKTSTSSSTTTSDRKPTPVFPRTFRQCNCGNGNNAKHILTRNAASIVVALGASMTPRPTISKNPSPTPPQTVTKTVPHLFISNQFNNAWLHRDCTGKSQTQDTNLVEWSWDTTGNSPRHRLYRVVYTLWDRDDPASEPKFCVCGCMKHGPGAGYNNFELCNFGQRTLDEVEKDAAAYSNVARLGLTAACVGAPIVAVAGSVYSKYISTDFKRRSGSKPNVISRTLSRAIPL